MTAKPSKSAKKREAQAVDELAKRLLSLSDDELADLPLGDDLRETLEATRRTRTHSAQRRQRLYLAKRLRQLDTAPIADACDALAEREGGARRLFHSAERWRDRLLAEDEPSLEEFFAVSGRDNPRLRELLEARRGARADAERRRLGREVFREIHADLAAVVQPDAGSI